MISLTSLLLIVGCMFGLVCVLSKKFDTFSEMFVKCFACVTGMMFGFVYQFGKGDVLGINYSLFYIILSVVILAILMLLDYKYKTYIDRWITLYRAEIYRTMAVIILITCFLDKLRV